MSLVTVLVNRDCPHCLRAVDQVAEHANRHGARVAAVDVTAHPEVAAAHGIRTSPAVILPDGRAVPGVPDASALTSLAAGASNPITLNA